MQFIVRCLLDALASDTLAEVALWIQKAHANEGQIQIAGLLAVIARKNAQTTGVDGQCLM